MDYLTYEEFQEAHAQAFGGYNVDEDALEPYIPAIGEVVFLFDWHRTVVVVDTHPEAKTVDVLLTHMDDDPFEKRVELMTDYPATWVRSAEVLN